MLRETSRPGSALASFLGVSLRCAALGLALSQMACVVTDPIAFPDEANVPPSIVSRALAANPLDKIVRFDVDQSGSSPDGGAPVPNEKTFEVYVRDPNLTQRLQAKIFVDGLGTSLDREVPPSAQLARPFEFTVAGSFLPLTAEGSGACHKVELLVSGEFRFGSREPLVDDDLAQAVWWVRSIDSGHTTVDMALCPR